MNRTATAPAAVVTVPSDGRHSASIPIGRIPVLILLITAAGGVGIYSWDTPHPENVVGGFLKLAAVGLLGLAALLATIWRGFLQWHRSKLNRLAEDKQREAQHTLALSTAVWEDRLKEERSSGERHLRVIQELENQMQELEKSKGVLRDELNKRNRNEKALTQRRQELESSKSVLELHVQARTQELQKLQRRYEMILNSAGEGICGLDLEGKATFVNPAATRITGWPIEELIGKSEQEIFCSNGTGSTGGADSQNARERAFRRKDGTLFPVELVKTPINESGRIIGSVVVFKDITERRRVEDSLARKASELARSNAELEQFAFVASHDLQEPLRKIQAFGDRLKGKVDGSRSEEVRDYLDRMQKAAARMQTLINDLLTFSRVIRTSQPFVPVSLTTVTKEVLGDLEVRIEKSGARVEIGDLPTIEADPLQMRQLMLNLIGNALKFQPPGGSPVVQVRAREIDPGAPPSGTNEKETEPKASTSEKLCEISVQDNGIGFDEKYSERIFAVFQRLQGRSEYEGTGVGLAVCRRITDRHGGTIVARSKPGQGSTFIVTVPCRQAKPEVKA